jgi:FlaA1/EpsC-like NDP-sugar epimerase
MIDERTIGGDTPSVSRVWARLAGRIVRMRSDLVVVALDMVLTAAAFAAMLLLRYDASVPDHGWSDFVTFAPIAMLVVVVSNLAWGLYGQLWRHASLYEALQLVKSGSSVMTVLLVVEWGPRHVPMSVVVTGTVMATFLMGLLRFQSRLFSYRRATDHPGLGVVVIGAGDAGAALVADMLHSPRAGFRPVAVLDEDAHRHGRSFMGIPVAGNIADLPKVVERTGANLAVFAMTNAPQELVRRAASAAEEADVALKIVPGISSAMNGGISLRDIRDVQIEDLLGREEVVTDLDAVRAILTGRRVLITGAGGSIGSEISRQVYACEPERLILLDHDETHLHDVAGELRDDRVVQVLADIRNRAQMHLVFNEHRPHVVFHAAAHKHVPLLEAHPTEAVMTNVVGTSNVLDAANEVGVERLVAISTDKAVYPSSVMGASKRIAEQLVIARTPPGAAYCAVRFGNVLGSRGSVVPTFMRQIEAGGPVTVTDPRMTRYFMSIEEAVQLVLQASALAETGSGGEVFMLDMGEPVLILELAERMIRLSGRQPGREIEILITGIRPGEKLAEELVAIEERELSTLHRSIRRIEPTSATNVDMTEAVHRLSTVAATLDGKSCVSLLLSLAGSTHLRLTSPAVGELATKWGDSAPMAATVVR